MRIFKLSARTHINHNDLAAFGLLQDLFAATTGKLVGGGCDFVQSNSELYQMLFGNLAHGNPKIPNVLASQAVIDEFAILARSHQARFPENFEVGTGELDRDAELISQDFDGFLTLSKQFQRF